MYCIVNIESFLYRPRVHKFRRNVLQVLSFIVGQYMAKAPVCCHKPRLQLDFTGFVEDLSVSDCMHINVQIVVCICRKKYIYIYTTALWLIYVALYVGASICIGVLSFVHIANCRFDAVGCDSLGFPYVPLSLALQDSRRIKSLLWGIMFTKKTNMSLYKLIWSDLMRVLSCLHVELSTLAHCFVYGKT